MKTHLTATFVDGVLKPDELLDLPDHARVNVTIEPLSDPSRSQAAWQSLKERIQHRPVHSAGHRFTRDELHERD